MSVLTIALGEDLVERVAERAQFEVLSVREYAAEALEAHLEWVKITAETKIEAGDILRREMMVDRRNDDDAAPIDIDDHWRTRDEVNGWEKKT